VGKCIERNRNDHLALNVTIDGDQGILTPTLTGAQPALYSANGKTVRPLGEESDKALALLYSLDDNQRKQAVLSYELADLVLGPGQDGKKIQPEGLKASAMNDKQRAMLLDVISEWADITRQARLRLDKGQGGKTKCPLKEKRWASPTANPTGIRSLRYRRMCGW
jgi:hypothetical protein